jgi:manganese/iron transport system ATP-binding protein/manganese/zinc/iron transport system ATP- binding protein
VSVVEVIPAVSTVIEARGVELRYGTGDPVVTGLDLALPGAEFVVVLGPNGGGKTSLFRALTGELVPSAGSLKVEASIAYLPQYDGSRVDFPVSALDVVLMGTLSERKLWQRVSRDDKRRAMSALERVGLADRADDTFGELSGGQRRRVLLARTIVGGAAVILLDEPLAGVDPRSGEAIRETLASLRDEGRLVIEASHDIEHARTADRVLCVNHRLIADGAPDAVLTDSTLRETYASDLAVITSDDGATLLATTDCCGHDHEHAH